MNLGTAQVIRGDSRHLPLDDNTVDCITIDMSNDYCRLAEWRTNDRNQIAKVLGVDKAPAPDDQQLDLFGEALA